jgi:hypothetical protein
MPLIDIDEFKQVLGVGDLYEDPQLEQVMDAASDVILDQLQRYKAQVDQICCPVTVTPPDTGTTIKFRTTTDHLFQVGQQIVLRGVGIPGFDDRTLTITVLEGKRTLIGQATTAWNPGTFDPRPLIPTAVAYLKENLDYYAVIPEVREAALAVAVDIWQSRVAPGGQIEGVDFTPGPYRLGRSLLSRVSGLLARWVDTQSLVG